MRGIIKVQGARELQRLIKNHGKMVRQEGSKLLRMQARTLASEYGAITDPPDMGGDQAVQGFKERIAKENRYIFPTREEPGKVFELIKQRDPALAAAYYSAVKSGKTSKAAAILRKSGVPQGGADPSAIKAARTGRRGRIPARAHPPVSLLRSSESRRSAREGQDDVGTPKAGWHQAAKAIGGRVRSNFVDADGKRSTAERFPAYVRLVSRRLSGLGGAMVSDERVTVFSNVRHAREAMSEDRQKGAEATARDRIGKAMKKMLEALARKFNSKAAA